MFDWLIVGAGLYGATFAREMLDKGKTCLVVEKRPYIGGNCADEWRDGILVQKHGVHIFHTNDAETWAFVNRFTDFWAYRHKVKVSWHGMMYSFPINLMTLHQIYGTVTPQEAIKRLAEERVNGRATDTLEGWALSQVGHDLYETFIRGYTVKQWGRSPAELPASIIRRIPIRLTYNDDYFDDCYQGFPADGYSAMISRMLSGASILTDTDYLGRPSHWNELATNRLYTGPIDALFDHDAGHLQYRSLRHEFEEHAGDYQGCATVNYTDEHVPFTRILEFKHFMQRPPADKTIIAKEYPMEWQPGKPRYYPINDSTNNALAKTYQERATAAGYEYGGRLADYRYYNMDQVVARARRHAQRMAV